MADAQAALAALASLRGSGRYSAAETLREIYTRHEQDAAADVLDAWLIDPPCSTRSGGPTSAHLQVELEAAD